MLLLRRVDNINTKLTLEMYNSSLEHTQNLGLTLIVPRTLILLLLNPSIYYYCSRTLISRIASTNGTRLVCAGTSC